MKNLNTFFKVAMFSFFLAAIVSGCMKNNDSIVVNPYEKEAVLMKAWLDSMVANGKNIDTTSTGIFYIREKAGSGPTVKAEDVVKVKYTGKFLDGTIFDASAWHYEDEKMIYLHKAPSDSKKTMIQGWEEGIEVLSKGGKAEFLIPSIKGYGSAGKGNIPPHTPLIFVIEVVDIK
jgi:FKBP-type peptidyl-prolyl cis-trans isomerase FkpA